MVDDRIIMGILQKRKEKLDALRDKRNFPMLVAEATKRGVPYEPKAQECTSCGIDGKNKKVLMFVSKSSEPKISIDNTTSHAWIKASIPCVGYSS